MDAEHAAVESDGNCWSTGLCTVSGYSAACFLGIALSVYALFVELRKHRDPGYAAACDIGRHASCSRVLTSPYGKGFGILRHLLGEQHVLNVPNTVVGLIFYIVQLVLVHLSFDWATRAMLYACVVACLGSVYLAYVLAFVLRDLCIVCCSTYAVNACLLYAAYQRFLLL
jgi:vitamin-K-epoxide reductase (warfarin-sensitive)